jgi:opacity protein-like surface antigen
MLNRNENIQAAGVGADAGRTRVLAVLVALAVMVFSSASGYAEESWDSFLSRYGAGADDRQFYLAGIIGADFATLNKFEGQEATVSNQSIFTAGGVAGIRLLRENGGLRFEFEGRGRDQVSDTYVDPDPSLGSLTKQATDGWSAMVNVWRDYKLFDHFGLNVGGGIGSGGYRSVISGTGLAGLAYSGNERVTNFAWQAGGGIFYEISQRVTLDLGYRFFSINASTATYDSIFEPAPVEYPTNFAASELLLTLRVYEPFRGWRRR